VCKGFSHPELPVTVSFVIVNSFRHALFSASFLIPNCTGFQDEGQYSASFGLLGSQNNWIAVLMLLGLNMGATLPELKFS